MAASVATSGFGTLIKIAHVLSPTVFDTIAEVTGITGPGEKMDTIECTHMESPSAYKEYLPSLLDAGEVSFDFSWFPKHVLIITNCCFCCQTFGSLEFICIRRNLLSCLL